MANVDGTPAATRLSRYGWPADGVATAVRISTGRLFVETYFMDIANRS